MEKIHNSTNDTYVNALSDISSAITSDLLLEDILRLIVLVAANVTRVSICSLWLVEEKNGSKILRLAVTQAINPDYVKDRALSMKEGIVGHVASEKKIMAIDNVLKDPRFKEKEMAEKLSLVSMLSVPMLTDDNKVIGVLNGFTCVAHHFSETEINLFKSVANKASIAIENAGRIVQAKVIERELEILK
ncbi:GAF domain-containing protein, partial [Patescibacteria group bacterium]|nr:GAF domain-containing protein [Patescibacteria group bacterium]